MGALDEASIPNFAAGNRGGDPAAQVCVPSGRDVLASERVFPGQSWQRLSDPAVLGWSVEKLQAAKDYAKSIRTPAVMLVVDGQILDEWGETSRRFQAHSIRKSFLSVDGIHVDARTIRLEKTLAQLGIDDNEPSLTETEKRRNHRRFAQSTLGCLSRVAVFTRVDEEESAGTRQPRAWHLLVLQ